MITSFFKFFCASQSYLLSLKLYSATVSLQKRVYGSSLLLGLLLCSVNVYGQRGFYLVSESGVQAPVQEKRYALVIGNAAYQHTGRLRNPINDAYLVKNTLINLNFEVDYITDASRSSMTNAIQRLARKAQGINAAVVFYYAGHGVQMNDDNYLIPIDANVESRPDIEVACVSLNYLMRQLEQANTGTNIIVLDACRINPFGYQNKRGTEGGLTVPTKSPSGTFIAFATAPSTIAADGDGNNSNYTAALVKAMQLPNIKIEDAFKAVRREVKLSGQIPWENSSLEGDFYFKPQARLQTEAEVMLADEKAAAQKAAKQRAEDEKYQKEADERKKRRLEQKRIEEEKYQKEADERKKQEQEVVNNKFKLRFNVSGGGRVYMHDRIVLSASRLDQQPQKTGIVVIDVCIDASGNIISTKFNSRISNTPDPELQQISIDNAKLYKFDTANIEKQCGTITYNFTLK